MAKLGNTRETEHKENRKYKIDDICRSTEDELIDCSVNVNIDTA